MHWGGPLPVLQKQNEEEAVHRRFVFRPCVYISAVFDSLSLYPYVNFGL